MIFYPGMCLEELRNTTASLVMIADASELPAPKCILKALPFEVIWKKTKHFLHYKILLSDKQRN